MFRETSLHLREVQLWRPYIHSQFDHIIMILSSSSARYVAVRWPHNVVNVLDYGLSGPGSSPGQGDIVLCSWARHFTLTSPLSTQVYKWVLENLMLGYPCDGLASQPGGSKNIHSNATETRICSSLMAWNT